MATTKHLTIKRSDLEKSLVRETVRIWERLAEIQPRLVKFDEPAIILNGRLWRKAGLADLANNKVELATKFFFYSQEYYDTMFRVILPHEIIHIADYVLFGESDKRCGHGTQWQKLMIQYGLKPDPYHYMTEMPQSFRIIWK